MDHASTDSKEKLGYLGGQAARGSLDGGVDGDRYPY